MYLVPPQKLVHLLVAGSRAQIPVRALYVVKPIRSRVGNDVAEERVDVDDGGIGPDPLAEQSVVLSDERLEVGLVEEYGA